MEITPLTLKTAKALAQSADMTVHRDRDGTEEWVLDPGRGKIKTLLGYDISKCDETAFRYEIIRAMNRNGVKVSNTFKALLLCGSPGILRRKAH